MKLTLVVPAVSYEIIYNFVKTECEQKFKLYFFSTKANTFSLLLIVRALKG